MGKNICPYCGANNSEQARFCNNCGESLGGIHTIGEGKEKGSESEKSYGILTGILLVLICGAIGFGGTMLYKTHMANKDQEGSGIVKDLQDEVKKTESESDQKAKEKAEKRKRKREERKIARRKKEKKEEAQMEKDNDNEDHTFRKKSLENEAYVIPDSDTRRLSRQDLTGLSKYELLYARNEIYARHGRRFDMKLLQDYFDEKPWYHGTVAAANFSSNVLSETEKANAAFIREYEKEKGYNSW